MKLNIVRKGVGGITENDVTLAQASNAIVIGFNVVPNAQARALAEEAGVDIRTYRVIYQAVQDIENAAKGLLGPEIREVPLGQAEVRATFRVPKLGVVAGCMVHGRRHPTEREGPAGARRHRHLRDRRSSRSVASRTTRVRLRPGTSAVSGSRASRTSRKAT